MKCFIAMVGCVAMVGLLCGCEPDSSDSNNNPPVMEPQSTGITPALGRYVMSVNGHVPSNGYWYQTTFVVTATNTIVYSSDTFSSYNIPIHDGGVSFSNGSYWWGLNGEQVNMQDNSGMGSPTDGFAIWAQWTSPNHCNGIVWFGDSNNGLAFTANR